ncbi:MAG: SprT-like domain-containing protein [Sedimenticola sp.]
MTSAIEQQALNKTLRLLKLAMEHYKTPLPELDIRFDLTGRAAGMIVFPAVGNPVIRYNRVLLSENPEPFVQQTLPHEVAHLVARTLFGSSIRPHGREWQEVMAFFGADARRCHLFDTSRSVRRHLQRFSYSCGCTTHQLTSIRHRRVLAGQVYRCRACGEALKE